MKRSDGIAYLTQCGDRLGNHYHAGYNYRAKECPTCEGTNRAPWLKCFSKYGATSSECAVVAWRLAYLMARESGESVTLDTLDHAMSMVVNDHDDVAYMVRNYGHGMYR